MAALLHVTGCSDEIFRDFQDWTVRRTPRGVLGGRSPVQIWRTAINGNVYRVFQIGMENLANKRRNLREIMIEKFRMVQTTKANRAVIVVVPTFMVVKCTHHDGERKTKEEN
jgi:hypothetical protein